ncbi:MAG: hypothetical protein IKU10_03865, partial [Clostridia bacterium]|nr:hypothetical protein [Clostridia bacterium]
MMEQIKSNLLYTLKNVEFCISKEEADKYLALMDNDGHFTDLDYALDNQLKGSWSTHMNRLSKLVSNVGWMADHSNQERVLNSFDAFAKEYRQNNKWWYNHIDLPCNCGRFYLCAEEYLNGKQKVVLRDYVLQGSIALNKDFLNSLFGVNLLWCVTATLYHAVIDNDPSILPDALQAAANELAFRQGQEGIQNDFSFFQNQTQFYNGGYGRSFVWQFANLVYALKETDYQFDNQALGHLAGFIMIGTRFCVRNCRYDFLTVGREISHPDALNADAIRKSLLLLLKVPEMPCRDVLQEQLASMCAEGYAVKGHRFFHESNYYAAKHVTFHIGCHGTSPLRTMGESIINENSLSANLYAGGATCIMVDGNEYFDIFPLWDFAHIPGTTAPAETDQELLTKAPLWQGKTADNTYCQGICHNNYGMMYQDLNFNGVKGVISRFFIDDIMIAMGAGLTCESDHNVTTTLNQCYQYDDKILTQKDGLPEHAIYQGRVAYASLDSQSIVIDSQEKGCDWSRINTYNPCKSKGTVCTFYIDHGKKPNNASYAYVVIPAVSANGAADRIQEVTKKITILRNDSGVQAIRYGDKILSVFHKNET